VTRFWRPLAAVLLIFLTMGAGCDPNASGGGGDSSSKISASKALSWPAPKDSLTPGGIDPDCRYSREHSRDSDQRDVTAETKRKVKKSYGYKGKSGIKYVEYDHRVPFWACGSNGPENIWPEPADGVDQSSYVHNRKDELEAFVARKVRNHKLSDPWTLEYGQQVFLDDWRKGWCKYIDDSRDGVSC
jgi:hypothetical protein